jgi:uncharacterized protein HemY
MVAVFVVALLSFGIVLAGMIAGVGPDKYRQIPPRAFNISLTM